MSDSQSRPEEREKDLQSHVEVVSAARAELDCHSAASRGGASVLREFVQRRGTPSDSVGGGDAWGVRRRDNDKQRVGGDNLTGTDVRRGMWGCCEE